MGDICILNFNHTYENQDFYKKKDYKIIDLYDLKNVSRYCDEKTLNIIRKKLYDIENYKIKFIDSGNYHYISYLILEKIKKRIIFYGVLDNLDNAIKSERISPLTGKIVGALNFNVIINIGNNVVKPTGTAKGYDTALASIQKLVFDRMGDVSKKSLFIGHANNLPKAIIMKNIMTKYNEFESVHIVEVGASIGTYTGEGAILVSVL